MRPTVCNTQPNLAPYKAEKLTDIIFTHAIEKPPTQHAVYPIFPYRELAIYLDPACPNFPLSLNWGWYYKPQKDEAASSRAQFGQKY